MSDSKRMAALEGRVKKLEAKSGRVSFAENELLEAARQRARVTKLGYYVETSAGGKFRADVGREGPSFEKMFRERMQHFASELLVEETAGDL